MEGISKEKNMKHPLILQSDFGLSDGAVSAMMGVALSIDQELQIYHNTHDIAPFNVHEASYRVFQSIQYWPPKSVFVSIVDPGVGTDRNSVVIELENGTLLVTPNNGTTSHIAANLKIKSVYEINIEKHRLKHSSDNYTFDGRDLYSALGAKLASGQLSLEEVGKSLTTQDLKTVPIGSFTQTSEYVEGCVEILDARYGSIWSSIPYEVFLNFNPTLKQKFNVTITHHHRVLFNDSVTFGRGFNDVSIGCPLLYNNSLNRIGLALNQGSFASAHHITPGLDVKIRVSII
jgi:S-adenosylmethionine hydrolase